MLKPTLISLSFFFASCFLPSLANSKNSFVLSVGDSIAAYPHGSYTAILSKVCAMADFYSYALPRKNPAAVIKSLRQDFSINKNFKPLLAKQDKWMILQGGINSVDSPDFTIKSLLATQRFAKLRGYKVISLSLTPWGDKSDPRWQGTKALLSMAATTKIVDFALRKKSPKALGLSAKTVWAPSETPEITIDLFYSELRHLNAKPWVTEKFKQKVQQTRLFKKLALGLPFQQKASRLESLAQAYAKFPQYFLAPEYRSFDHIHLNRLGHKIIAEKICRRMSKTWKCQCGTIAKTDKLPKKLIRL